MITRSAILLLVTVLAPAQAQPDPAATVRGYFAALGRNDFQGALSLTQGAALERTARLVGTLRQQAAAAKARVVLKVRRVEVSPPAVVEGGQEGEVGAAVPIDVRFDIDVVGKKWWFSRVARKLSGRAQFYVDAQRIVAIEGHIE